GLLGQADVGSVELPPTLVALADHGIRQPADGRENCGCQDAGQGKPSDVSSPLATSLGIWHGRPHPCLVEYPPVNPVSNLQRSGLSAAGSSEPQFADQGVAVVIRNAAMAEHARIKAQQSCQ